MLMTLVVRKITPFSCLQRVTNQVIPVSFVHEYSHQVATMLSHLSKLKEKRPGTDYLCRPDFENLNLLLDQKTKPNPYRAENTT